MKPDLVNKMGADLAVQLMLVTVLGLLARMAPDTEKEVRNGAKQVIAGVLQRARTVN